MAKTLRPQSLRIKQVKEGLRVFEESIKRNFDGETIKGLKSIVVSIGAYSVVTFLGMFFILNLLRGQILGSWWIILMNFVGAGCSYYVLIDFLQFVIESVKAKK